MKADQALQRLPVILLTGGVGAGEVVEARAAGADAFPGKPFRIAELRTAMRRVLPSGSSPC